MNEWSRKERFDALLSGEKADRPMVSGWRHFLDEERSVSALADITVASTRDFDWDWVKINPRATYYAEAWGNTYDFNDYRGVFPRQKSAAISTVGHLGNVTAISVGDAPALREQVECAALIRTRLPDTPLTQTLFSPLTVLLFLAGQSAYANDSVYGSPYPIALQELLTADRAATHRTLKAIASTLAEYAQQLGQAGLDGIFYAVAGTANPALFDSASFEEFSRPYDLIVLEAASFGKRILHTCGSFSHPETFADYPIEGLSWDIGAPGNPGLQAAFRPTPVTGIPHALFASGSPNEIRQRCRAALERMNDRPFALSPDCAVPIASAPENLHALREAVL